MGDSRNWVERAVAAARLARRCNEWRAAEEAAAAEAGLGVPGSQFAR